jgi:hypothetical protein
VRAAHIAVVALAVLALAVVAPVFAVADPTLTLTFVAPDKTALANALVKVFDSSGNLVANATTDSSGKATLTVSATGLYNIVAAGSGYYILTVLNVTGDTTATIDASAMYKVDVLSTLKSVEFKLSRSETPNAKIVFSTNTTVYTDKGKTIDLEFPPQVMEFPFVYRLTKIVYDGAETTNSTITIAVDADKAVTAYYEKLLILQVLPVWALAAIAVVILIALATLAFAPRMAKKVIMAVEEESREFVKRKKFAKRSE